MADIKRCVIALFCIQTVLFAQIKQPYEKAPAAPSKNIIDRLVRNDLKTHGIEPANPCSDDVFLRRVYLDLIGQLPTPGEQHAFTRNKRPDKRATVIDQLMDRKEFVDYWTMKWCDLLRVKAEFPINLWPNGVQVYYRWIHDAVRVNMPYDQFATELLTSSGSNFRTPQVNFYRAVQGRKPEDLAGVVALTFMGSRFDKWPETKRREMAVFFNRVAYKRTSEWKEEVVYLNPAPVKTVRAKLPDGTDTTLDAQSDPRRAFADWLVTGKNTDFTATMANRMWYWLMGQGIVHEPDDRRADNPPSNPALLKALQKELVSSKFDLRHLMKLILNSQTYQQSSIPRSKSPKATAHFAHYVIRPMEAEVLVDVLTWVFGRGEKYLSQIPEPFTFIPMSHRAVTLADGSITSQFLEMFGRPSRDTGLASERGQAPSAAQRLFLLNSQEIQRGLRSSWRLKGLIKAGKKNKMDPITVIYRTFLCRPPTAKERAIAQDYAKTHKFPKKEVAIDLAWALLNSKEFLYKH